MEATWRPVQPDFKAIFEAYPEPLEALIAGQIPAAVLRNAYPVAACQQLTDRLIEQELLYDPTGPLPETFQEQVIPDGTYIGGISNSARQAPVGSTKRRIDVGTSLGYRGSNPEGFFEHAQQTHKLFEHLFDGLPNPVRLLYERLSELSRGKKRAVTAYEPDGRKYGPVIIRAHYGPFTYAPHFDSVKLREKRQRYAVYSFDHQLGGVLILQNSERDGDTAQSIIHHYLWQPEVQSFLDEKTFHEFAKERGIESCRVVLNPGDLYFFNTRLIHEVPGVDGVQPRIVLAAFIGYSASNDEMFLWS